MSKTLRKSIEKAIKDIEKYKEPNISDVQNKLNEILKAANLGSTGCDNITYLYISNSKQDKESSVIINTSYSVKSCDCSDRFEFPAFIIDSEDPVQSAKKWGLEKELTQLRQEVSAVERKLTYLSTQLETKESEFAEFMNLNLSENSTKVKLS